MGFLIAVKGMMMIQLWVSNDRVVKWDDYFIIIIFLY